jgi:hypothetical protein
MGKRNTSLEILRLVSTDLRINVFCDAGVQGHHQPFDPWPKGGLKESMRRNSDAWPTRRPKLKDCKEILGVRR